MGQHRALLTAHDETCLRDSEYLLQDLTPPEALLLVSLTTLSVVVVCIELARLWLRHRKRKTTTEIGIILERLVFTQGFIDLFFHLVDYTFNIDCDASPLMDVLLDQPRSALWTERTLLYKTIKEFLGLLSVWWHAVTAHAIFCWIVLKHSAGRLRRPRQLPCLILLALFFSGLRILLYETVRENLLGLYLGNILYDFILIPLPILAMTRWNIGAAKALADATAATLTEKTSGGGSQSQSLHRRSASGGEKKKSAGGAGAGAGADAGGGSGGGHKHVSDLEVGAAAGGGSSSESRQNTKDGSGSRSSSTQANSNTYTATKKLGGALSTLLHGGKKQPQQTHQMHHSSSGGGNAARNRIIIARLLRVSVVVSLMWLCIVGVDAAIWIKYYQTGRGVADWGLWIRTLFMRLVGFIDAVIMGNLLVTVYMHVKKIVVRWCPLCVLARRRKRSPSGAVLTTTGGGGGRGEGGGGANNNVLALRTRLVKAISSAMPFEVSSVGGFSGAGGRSRTGLVSGVGGGGGEREDELFLEQELAASVQRLEALNHARDAGRRMESMLVFASTWNMGGVDRESVEGGALGHVLPTWIPHGYDLYVSGVQECACIREFRKALHEHLGGSEVYTMVGKEIGDDMILHGFIALTLFVRTSQVRCGAVYVEEGAVEKVASGMSLGPMGRAPNKGYTGIAVRVHDASLACITSHFASDKKGKNKVEKRNQDACRTLKDLSLLWDNDSYSIHTQSSHTLLLGDLNYRNNCAPEKVLRLVAQSAQACQEEANKSTTTTTNSSTTNSSSSSSSSNWRRKKYEPFFALPKARDALAAAAAAAAAGGGGASVAALAGAGPSPPPPLLFLGRHMTSLRGTYIREEESSTSSSHAENDVALVRTPSHPPMRGPPGGGEEVSALTVASSGGGGDDDPPSSSSSNSSAATGGKEQQQQHQQSTTVSAVSFSGGDAADGGGPTSSYVSASSSTLPEWTSFPMLSHLSLPSTPYSSSIQSEEPQPQTHTHTHTQPFDWVPRYDELIRSMRKRRVFYNFSEGKITFPPSYRWNRVPKHTHTHTHIHTQRETETDLEKGEGIASAFALAGDFTDVGVLSQAYTLAVADKKKWKPASALFKSLVGKSWSAVAEDGGGGGGGGGAGGAVSPDIEEGSLATTPGGGSSSAGGRDGNGSGERRVKIDVPLPTAATVATGSSARTPSYTDRILTHSLPGTATNLRWLLYETADLVGFSDHRPVCAALEMRVDKDVLGFQMVPAPTLTPATSTTATAISVPRPMSLLSPPPPPPGVGPAAADPSTPFSLLRRQMSEDSSHLAVFTITMARPTLRLCTRHLKNKKRGMMSGLSWLSGGGTGGRDGEEERDTHTHHHRNRGSTAMKVDDVLEEAKPTHVTILFPIISEDPFAFERKASQLGEALPGLGLGDGGEEGGATTPATGMGGGGGGGGGNDMATTSSSLRVVRWDDFPLRLRVVASKRFSEHLLLKVTDAQRRDLGQAIVPIALAWSKPGQPPQQQQQQQEEEEDGPVISPTLKAASTTTMFLKGGSSSISAGTVTGGGSAGANKHRFHFGLSSGGVFKGYLSLDMRVKTRNLSAEEEMMRGGVSGVGTTTNAGARPPIDVSYMRK